MRIIIKPSENSTPRRPLYVWYVLDANLRRGFGIERSEEAAREAAEKVYRRYSHQSYTWSTETGEL